MNLGNFVIYKIEPNQMDLDGKVNLDKNSHGRIFLHSTIEVKYNTIIFRDTDDQTIQGIFPSLKYYILQYDNR